MTSQRPLKRSFLLHSNWGVIRIETLERWILSGHISLCICWELRSELGSLYSRWLSSIESWDILLGSLLLNLRFCLESMTLRLACLRSLILCLFLMWNLCLHFKQCGSWVLFLDEVQVCWKFFVLLFHIFNGTLTSLSWEHQCIRCFSIVFFQFFDSVSIPQSIQSMLTAALARTNISNHDSLTVSN